MNNDEIVTALEHLGEDPGARLCQSDLAVLKEAAKRFRALYAAFAMKTIVERPEVEEIRMLGRGMTLLDTAKRYASQIERSVLEALFIRTAEAFMKQRDTLREMSGHISNITKDLKQSDRAASSLAHEVMDLRAAEEAGDRAGEAIGITVDDMLNGKIDTAKNLLKEALPWMDDYDSRAIELRARIDRWLAKEV